MYVLRKKDVPLTKKIDKENLFVRDLSTSKVLSVENIILNMTSKELLTLNSILNLLLLIYTINIIFFILKVLLLLMYKWGAIKL